MATGLQSFELVIDWPEMDIDGLQWPIMKTRNSFEYEENNVYYSRDIVFLSQRDVLVTGNDNLNEYIGSERVYDAIQQSLDAINSGMSLFLIRLPKEYRGKKRYRNRACDYWLDKVRYENDRKYYGYGNNEYTDWGNELLGVVLGLSVLPKQNNHKENNEK